MLPVSRLLVPLVTPFTDDTVVLSEIRLSRLIKYHREHQAAGFVVMSEAGEYASCSLAERKQCLEWTVREAAGMPVYVNATAATTSSAVDLCQHAARHGARGAVMFLPSHTALLEPEIKAHVAAVRRYGNLPVGILDPAAAHVVVDEASPFSGSEPQALERQGIENYRAIKLTTTTEFWTPDGVSHALAVAGADFALQVMADWDRLGTVVQGLFRLGGAARVGKAAWEDDMLDLGSPRGPLLPLDHNGRQVLAHLREALNAR